MGKLRLRAGTKRFNQPEDKGPGGKPRPGGQDQNVVHWPPGLTSERSSCSGVLEPPLSCSSRCTTSRKGMGVSQGLGPSRLTQRPQHPLVSTWKGVTGEAQLADDVAGDVCLDKVALLSMALSCLQQVVELFGVEFLRQGRVRSG